MYTIHLQCLFDFLIVNVVVAASIGRSSDARLAHGPLHPGGHFPTPLTVVLDAYVGIMPPHTEIIEIRGRTKTMDGGISTMLHGHLPAGGATRNFSSALANMHLDHAPNQPASKQLPGSS